MTGPALVALLALLLAPPAAVANAIVDHEVVQDDSGTQLDWRRPDNSQRGYVRIDEGGWAGAGTHDGAANGAGAHVGTETTVGYGLGSWWCDAGVHADEPDLVYSRGTECWNYECLDDGTQAAAIAGYATAHPVEYATYVLTLNLC